jgi:hypothetical protein
MSSVLAVTEEMIFKARVASFYELTNEGRMKLCQEFGKWLKEKGIENDFLVWRVQIDIEGKKND